VSGRTCEQCGQPLPASYSPPADEDWAIGILSCHQDTNTCVTGLFCPCLLFGRNVAAMNDEISPKRACVGHAVCIEGGIAVAALTAAFNGVIDPDTVCLLTEGLFFAWWVCAIYTGMGRQLLQRKYHLK
ncbi:PLAC8 family protein, partial [Perilla frutescens var. frutescens]